MQALSSSSDGGSEGRFQQTSEGSPRGRLLEMIMTRNWLVLEALALTLPATLLLAAGLPIAAMAIVAVA